MIDKKNLTLFLKNVSNDLEGHWVIIGGALLGLLETSDRSTMDIDICPIDEMTNDLRLQLMTIALNSGLPIESINPAADFFIRQIPHWKSNLIPWIVGQKGSVFRPSFYLYFQLKVQRLTESDIIDIKSYYVWCNTQSESIDLKKIRETIDSEIQKTNELIKKDRLLELKKNFI